MSAVNAKDVMLLRDRTSLPMMECKAALTEAAGDMEKAVNILRARFKGAADKRVGRETAEGRIAAYSDLDAKVGAIVEIRCESPTVAKSEHFVALGTDVAKHVAVKNPTTVEELL